MRERAVGRPVGGGGGEGGGREGEGGRERDTVYQLEAVM